jgi:hypothetical protein
MTQNDNIFCISNFYRWKHPTTIGTGIVNVMKDTIILISEIIVEQEEFENARCLFIVQG